MVESQSAKALQFISGDDIENLLSEKQLAVWNWIQGYNSEFSRKDVIGAVNFPGRTVESIIKKLLDLNRLEKLGEGRATRYRLK